MSKAKPTAGYEVHDLGMFKISTLSRKYAKDELVFLPSIRHQYRLACVSLRVVFTPFTASFSAMKSAISDEPPFLGKHTQYFP